VASISSTETIFLRGRPAALPSARSRASIRFHPEFCTTVTCAKFARLSASGAAVAKDFHA